MNGKLAAAVLVLVAIAVITLSWFTFRNHSAVNQEAERAAIAAAFEKSEFETVRDRLARLEGQCARLSELCDVLASRLPQPSPAVAAPTHGSLVGSMFDLADTGAAITLAGQSIQVYPLVLQYGEAAGPADKVIARLRELQSLNENRSAALEKLAALLPEEKRLPLTSEAAQLRRPIEKLAALSAKGELETNFIVANANGGTSSNRVINRAMDWAQANNWEGKSTELVKEAISGVFDTTMKRLTWESELRTALERCGYGSATSGPDGKFTIKNIPAGYVQMNLPTSGGRCKYISVGSPRTVRG